MNSYCTHSTENKTKIILGKTAQPTLLYPLTSYAMWSPDWQSYFTAPGLFLPHPSHVVLGSLRGLIPFPLKSQGQAPQWTNRVKVIKDHQYHSCLSTCIFWSSDHSCEMGTDHSTSQMSKEIHRWEKTFAHFHSWEVWMPDSKARSISTLTLHLIKLYTITNSTRTTATTVFPGCQLKRMEDFKDTAWDDRRTPEHSHPSWRPTYPV